MLAGVLVRCEAALSASAEGHPTCVAPRSADGHPAAGFRALRHGAMRDERRGSTADDRPAKTRAPSESRMGAATELLNRPASPGRDGVLRLAAGIVIRFGTSTYDNEHAPWSWPGSIEVPHVSAADEHARKAVFPPRADLRLLGRRPITRRPTVTRRPQAAYVRAPCARDVGPLLVSWLVRREYDLALADRPRIVHAHGRSTLIDEGQNGGRARSRRRCRRLRGVRSIELA
ncbi:hypothetical protein [Bordetella pertussis]|uniref:hypothetical protein n=1 Tax=Bordetella pertussis TaxID=520 RepID=UPI0011AB346E|nr:hypothetical protein [Bordetella pertussis]